MFDSIQLISHEGNTLPKKMLNYGKRYHLVDSSLWLTQLGDGCGYDPDADQEGDLHPVPLQVEDLEALCGVVVVLLPVPLGGAQLVQEDPTACGHFQKRTARILNNGNLHLW